MRGSILALGAVVLAMTAITSAAIEPDAPQRLITAEEVVGIKARRLVENGEGAAGEVSKATRSALVDFYSSRDSKPLWISKDGLTNAATTAIAEIRKADDWGLDASAFDLRNIDIGGDASQEELANAEISVSLAILKYADHARGGRIPDPANQLSSYLDRKPQLLEPAVVLDEISKASDTALYLRELNPQHPQFLDLRKALLDLRRPQGGTAEAQVVRLPASGPLLSLGKNHPDVALLRKRLDVPAGDNPEAFDEDVEEAVKEFQSQAGLYTDGVVGSNTRSTLNGGKASVTEDMLIANMEQWRWMPRETGEFYVTANIPEYQVRVVDAGKVVHEARIIVGETGKQTPVFSDVLETVVFHPFWGVPNSIKVNELLPSIARGGNALQRSNLRLQYRGREVDPRTVDWSTADIRNFHVYQPPGRGNVLGEVKFLFPNHHQVYMHDTPTKHLFSKTQRTYSHGCMRVQDPLKLAEAVLKYDKGWTMSKVNATVDNGPENNNVKVERRVPVHVTYFTAAAGPDGSIKAFPDVYGHERRIKLALAGRWNEIDKGRDHLAPVRIDRSRIAVRQNNNDNPISNFMQQVFGF